MYSGSDILLRRISKLLFIYVFAVIISEERGWSRWMRQHRITASLHFGGLTPASPLETAGLDDKKLSA